LNDPLGTGGAPSLQALHIYTFSRGFNQVKRSLSVLHVLLYTLFILSAGCAPLRKPAPLELLTINDAGRILSEINDHSGSIRSFYSLGLISIKGRILGSDADILIAGIKDPFTLKIEITHSWGTPVLHLLIREGSLFVLSHQEKLKYYGTFTPETLSKFLPGFNLDREMIWSILSGRPPVVSHKIVTVSGSDTISLRSGDGIELEAMNFPFRTSFPERITFPVQSLNVFFHELKEDTGIPYSGVIKLSGAALEKDLVLKIERIAFNATVPDQIFTMETPSGYGTVYLDDLPENEGE